MQLSFGNNSSFFILSPLWRVIFVWSYKNGNGRQNRSSGAKIGLQRRAGAPIFDSYTSFLIKYEKSETNVAVLTNWLVCWTSNIHIMYMDIKILEPAYLQQVYLNLFFLLLKMNEFPTKRKRELFFKSSDVIKKNMNNECRFWSNNI